MAIVRWVTNESIGQVEHNKVVGAGHPGTAWLRGHVWASKSLSRGTRYRVLAMPAARP